MLYLCPTPIGNLEDITIRTLHTLKSVDVILCEDTRVSQKLLSHYNISKKTMSFHKYNIKKRMPEVIELLKAGYELAYITDAGMPGISDPGAELIKMAQTEDIKYSVLPGPTASITALVMSGLDNERFLFVGFLDDRSSRRKSQLHELENEKSTLIFYESPYRIISLLEDIKEVFGDRKVSLCREITKIYEEVVTGKVSDLLEQGITTKGEMVLVVEGKVEENIEIDIEAELKLLLNQGYSKKDGVKCLVKKYGLNRNEVYEISLKI